MINNHMHFFQNIQFRQTLTRFFIIFSVALLSLLLLGFFVKGVQGKGTTLYYQTEQDKGLQGPFEAPNSSSRFALTRAIVENNSVLLTRDLAEFALPDLVSDQGRYYSIFTPGISFIGVPFYILGKQYGFQQLFAYFSVTIFAFINMLLVARISYKLGANLFASLLSGFIFLFGTNELSYGISYAQHATSVTFLLLSFLLVLGKRSVLKNILFGVFSGVSILLDIPNIILLLPSGIYLLLQHIHLEKHAASNTFSFNTKLFALLFGIIPFITLMAWYNFHTTGSYTQLAQSIGQASGLDPKPQSITNDTTETSYKILPFASEMQIRGIYTLLFSDERSVTVYSPVVLLGIFGIVALYKRRQKLVAAHIIASTVLLNIILYSLFGDPWGGWSFGPRYLIPACAMLSIGLGVAIQVYKKKLWFGILFGITALYSLFINIIGALTTSLIPSKHDALNTHPHLPYTYSYNIDLINQNKLSSLLYNFFFSTIPSWEFVFFLICFATLIVVSLYIFSFSLDRKKEESI